MSKNGEKSNGIDSYRVIPNRFRNNIQTMYKSDSFESYQNEEGIGSEIDYHITRNHVEGPNFDDDGGNPLFNDRIHSNPITNEQIQEINQCYEQNCNYLRQIFNLPEMQKAIKGIIHLADQMRKDDEDTNVCSINSVMFMFNNHWLFYHRLLKIGNSWQWFLIVFSFMSLLLPYFVEHVELYCKHRLFMIQELQ